MRLKSHIWVSAYLRRLDYAMIPAAVVRRGDADAGAIYIKVSMLEGQSQILAPIPAYALDGLNGKGSSVLQEEGRAWQAVYGIPAEDHEADAYLQRQASMDPDMWIIDVENRNGRHLVGDLTPAGIEAL